MKRVVLVLAVLILANLACGQFPISRERATPRVAEVPTALALPTALPEGTAPSASEEALLINLYERANPAVVNIDVAGALEGELTELGSGSGFVIDKQGHIVTNNHVVVDAEEMIVTFWDGRAARASLVGQDPYSDLAVIKVEVPEDRLFPLELGDSDELRVGQQVIAIGNPFGLRGSMTVGIISALGRSLSADVEGEARYFQNPDIIQTDAAINPGNSGGPLLNLRGQVIGINSAIRTEGLSTVNSGVGFAVSSNTVRRVAPQLIEKGSVSYPYLGVTVDNRFTLAEVSLEVNMPVDQGVLITSVPSGGPAEQAGLRGGDDIANVRGSEFTVGGDIIIAIEGIPIHSFDEMIVYLINKTQVGQTVDVTVIRDGQELQVPVKLGERPK